jgi:hypothetical protein
MPATACSVIELLQARGVSEADRTHAATVSFRPQAFYEPSQAYGVTFCLRKLTEFGLLERTKTLDPYISIFWR